MEERAFKGIWIPKEIWLSNELTLQEKIFLVEIESLDNDKGCFASNTYFAKFFNLVPQRVSVVINSLKKKGYLSIEIERNGKQIIKRIIRILKPPYPIEMGINQKLIGYQSNIDRGYQQNDKGVSIKGEEGYQQNVKENNTIYNNTINNTYSEELDKALNDFYEMRIKIKQPMTDRAKKLLISELNKLSTNEQEQIEILSQSIINNWKSVYKLKDGSKKTEGGNNKWKF